MHSSPKSLMLMLVAAGALFAAGCGSDDTSPGGLCTEDESLLTYENFGEPFMRDWCTSCHSSDLEAAARANAPVDVNLDSRGGVLFWRDRIGIRAAPAGATMPPTAGPGEEEKALLQEWLDCGAP